MLYLKFKCEITRTGVKLFSSRPYFEKNEKLVGMVISLLAISTSSLRSNGTDASAVKTQLLILIL